MMDAHVENDMYDRFYNIIREADKKTGPLERTEFLLNRAEKFKDVLAALEKAGDWVRLGAILKVLARESLTAGRIPFASRPSEKFCEGLKENEEEIQSRAAAFNFTRAENLKTFAQSGKGSVQYTDRHRMIESAISLIVELFDRSSGDYKWPYAGVKTEKEACDFIAECYLFRARLALTKGSQTPAKKLEALTKALEWAERGSREIDELKARIALERETWDKNVPRSRLPGVLEKFLKNHALDLTRMSHWMLLDKAREKGLLSTGEDQRLLEADPAGVKGEIHASSPALLKARAALRLEIPDISGPLTAAVKDLKGKPLSWSPWAGVTGLLDDVSEREMYTGQWEPAALEAWRLCQVEEARIKLSVQLRWYWSESRKLYDLAVKAASNREDPLLVAEIADSRKSRPTIKLRAIEMNLSGEKDREALKKLKELDTAHALDDYKINLHVLKKKADPGGAPETRPLDDIPAGWAAAHFYLSEKEACAVVIEGKARRRVTLDISGMYDAWRKWEADRRELSDIGDSGSSLETLCRKAGEMLKPALDGLQSDNILFVPHGFLHLTPLHAAILADGNYLFMKKRCLFLPSWSLAPVKDPIPSGKDDFLLTNWAEIDDPEGRVKHLRACHTWRNVKRIENTAGDFFAILKENGGPPGRMFFLSHGMGNQLNPYLSGLVMAGDERLTHQAILHRLDPFALEGAGIVLTACDTDLAPGSFSLIDEHLSLSSAFLGRGAREVLGALYPCTLDISCELVGEATTSPKTSLAEILSNKQKEWAEKKNPSVPLYKMAVFRAMGFPTDQPAGSF